MKINATDMAFLANEMARRHSGHTAEEYTEILCRNFLPTGSEHFECPQQLSEEGREIVEMLAELALSKGNDIK